MDAIGETPGWPRPYSEAVRCRDCRHFVELEYPPLGRCAVNQPAPVRGGLFWGIDKRACGAYEDRLAGSVALRLDPASRLRAWLRQLSIDIVVPFDELLAFYHDDFDDLAALSLDELTGLIADYKRHRADYRRLVSNRLERPAETIDETGVTTSVVSMAAA